MHYSARIATELVTQHMCVCLEAQIRKKISQDKTLEPLQDLPHLNHQLKLHWFAHAEAKANQHHVS